MCAVVHRRQRPHRIGGPLGAAKLGPNRSPASAPTRGTHASSSWRFRGPHARRRKPGASARQTRSRHRSARLRGRDERSPREFGNVRTGLHSPHMGVKRIKPNILSERFDESRVFYNEVIGLDGGDGLDWILFFGTDQHEVQLSVMKLDIKAHIHPDVSIEVDDVDQVYGRARAAGAEIVYPLTDEEWGLRRFFVRDPNGTVINVTEHGD